MVGVRRPPGRLEGQVGERRLGVAAAPSVGDPVADSSLLVRREVLEHHRVPQHGDVPCLEIDAVDEVAAPSARTSRARWPATPSAAASRWWRASWSGQT